jgi:hypothetical protein
LSARSIICFTVSSGSSLPPRPALKLIATVASRCAQICRTPQAQPFEMGSATLERLAVEEDQELLAAPTRSTYWRATARPRW